MGLKGCRRGEAEIGCRTGGGRHPRGGVLLREQEGRGGGVDIATLVGDRHRAVDSRGRVGGFDTEGDERPGGQGRRRGRARRLDGDPHDLRISRGSPGGEADTRSCSSFLLPRVRVRARARDYNRGGRAVKADVDTAPVWAGGVEADGRVGGPRKG